MTGRCYPTLEMSKKVEEAINLVEEAIKDDPCHGDIYHGIKEQLLTVASDIHYCIEE